MTIVQFRPAVETARVTRLDRPIVGAERHAPDGLTERIGFRDPYRDGPLTGPGSRLHDQIREPYRSTPHRDRFAVHVLKDGVLSTTIVSAAGLSDATDRARTIFNHADSITVEVRSPSELEALRANQLRQAAHNAAVREAHTARRDDPLPAEQVDRVRARRLSLRIVTFCFWLVAALLIVLLVAGCSGGGSPDQGPQRCDEFGCVPVSSAEPPPSEPPPEPEPAQSEPPTRAELNALPNGRVFGLNWPSGQYTKRSGVCLIRYPYEPGPPPYNDVIDFRGACFGKYHHDWFFRISPRSRIGNVWHGFNVQDKRGELRQWEVIGGALTGVYEVTGDFAPGLVPSWRSDEPSIAFAPIFTSGMQTATGGVPVGVYRYARRSAPCCVDLIAEYLNVGVATALVIDADGSLYAAGGDGCIVEGETGDHLAGVVRYTLTNSCIPGGTFDGVAGSAQGRTYVAAQWKHDHFVIVAEY